uniref:Si:dkeyp-73b11.8 n=2 Tax=Mastacembelus armatus TaxID=205130 RepID=A0A3Q3LLB8_9TELE
MMKHLLFLGIAFAALHISHSEIPDFCYLPQSDGEGFNFLYAVYYDAAQDQCSPFIYKGEGGNANRFRNERECMRNCSANAKNIYPINETQACRYKKAIGQCSAQIMSYYYDSAHGKCKTFFWSGCIGNGNRFSSYEHCNATCAGIYDDDGSDEEEEIESDTPIAIICGVLLGVIIAAVLITVIVLTVKSK